MIGFVTLGHLFCTISYKQKVANGDKPNMVGKTPCELLYSFEVKVCNKWLAMNFLALADIKTLSR